MVTWRDPVQLANQGFPRLSRAVESLKEEWGDGPLVVYDVHDLAPGTDGNDQEFWVTTISGLHMGIQDKGEPSFTLNTMKKDPFMTAIYKRRKARELTPE